MGHRHLSDVELVEYADGATAPSRVRRVEDHLQECAACAEAVAGARRTAAVVGQMQAVAVPDGLRQRVAAELAATPAGSLSCREAGPLIHARIDRELAPAGVAALQRHLRGCLRCQAEMAAFSAVARLVRSLRAAPAPWAVREAVWAALRLASQRQASSGQARWVRPVLTPWPVRLRPVLAAAVATAAGVLVLFWAGQRFERPRTPAIAIAPGVSRQPGGEPQQEATGRQKTVLAGLAGAASGEAAVPGSGKVERPVGGVSAEARKRHLVVAQAASAWAKAGASLRYGAAGAQPISADEARVEKGPAREPVEPTRVKTAPRLPSAVRTLKEIAMAYAVPSEGQQALALAGEKFVTLDSESTLARLPEAAGVGKPAARPAPGPGAGEGKTGPEGEQGRNRAENPAPKTPVV